MVAWSRVKRPTQLGGLGILDLTTLGYALRLRWEWQSRTMPYRLWAALPSKLERNVQAMFQASVSAQVGNGNKALFWSNRWIDGCSMDLIAPDVASVVSKCIRKTRTVVEGLLNDQGHSRFSLRSRSRPVCITPE
jgi:hypothetical protein